MTIYAPEVDFDTAEMSVVTRNLVAEREVKPMTNATALDRLIDAPDANWNRSHGLDRSVQRLAVAMLKWSRTRMGRDHVTHEERSHRLQESSSTMQREADALRLTQRIGL